MTLVPDKEAVSDFEIVYLFFQQNLGLTYPLYWDSDRDGVINQAGFLSGTDPSVSTDYPTVTISVP